MEKVAYWCLYYGSVGAVLQSMEMSLSALFHMAFSICRPPLPSAMLLKSCVKKPPWGSVEVDGLVVVGVPVIDAVVVRVVPGGVAVPLGASVSGGVKVREREVMRSGSNFQGSSGSRSHRFGRGTGADSAGSS